MKGDVIAWLDTITSPLVDGIMGQVEGGRAGSRCPGTRPGPSDGYSAPAFLRVVLYGRPGGCASTWTIPRPNNELSNSDIQRPMHPTLPPQLRRFCQVAYPCPRHHLCACRGWDSCILRGLFGTATSSNYTTWHSHVVFDQVPITPRSKYFVLISKEVNIRIGLSPFSTGQNRTSHYLVPGNFIVAVMGTSEGPYTMDRRPWDSAPLHVLEHSTFNIPHVAWEKSTSRLIRDSVRWWAWRRKKYCGEVKKWRSSASVEVVNGGNTWLGYARGNGDIVCCSDCELVFGRGRVTVI